MIIQLMINEVCPLAKYCVNSKDFGVGGKDDVCKGCDGNRSNFFTCGYFKEKDELKVGDTVGK